MLGGGAWQVFYRGSRAGSLSFSRGSPAAFVIIPGATPRPVDANMHRPRDSTDGHGRLQPRAQGDGTQAFADLHAAPGPPDADLLRRLAAGDREAFETLYLRHWQGLLNFITRRYPSLDHHAAEDVASETLTGLWPDRHRLVCVLNLRAYLKGIAQRFIAEELADRMADMRELSVNMASSALSPGDAVAQDELARQLTRAVETLAKSHRMALEMSQAGVSAKRIAAISNCTEKAAQRRVEKAREQLTRALSRCGSACVMDTHGEKECPARKENLYCLKFIYRRVLRLH